VNVPARFKHCLANLACSNHGIIISTGTL